jgi:uncharacterized protein (DUF983 family)
MIRLQCPHCGKGMAVADEHAGKKARCSGCKEVLNIPAAATDHAVREIKAPSTSPKGKGQPPPLPGAPAPLRKGEPPAVSNRRPMEDDDAYVAKLADDEEEAYVARLADEDDDWDDDTPRRKRKGKKRTSIGLFEPCPNCGAEDPKRVSFTWWGGALGPWMFTHVACQECGTTYNGKTGKSNNTAIAIYTILGFVLAGFVAALSLLFG